MAEGVSEYKRFEVSMPSRRLYSLCGWRVDSALPLPELPLWTGSDGEADIVIDLGVVPPSLDDVVLKRPFLQADASGLCRYAVPGVCAYLIDPEGRRVTVAPEMDPGAPDIRLFLFGTVFGLLCYRRGLVPLHASCVRIGDGAVAFAGQSGMGKSTLAASLVLQGHELLADDITVIDALAPGGPRVLPSFPRIKLWGDAFDRLDLSSDGLENSRTNLDKFHWPVDTAFQTDPLPLTAIFHLDPDTPPDGGPLRRLQGAEAAARFMRDLYRRAMMTRLGLAKQVLASSSPVLGVPGGIWLVAHTHEPGGLERSVSAILDRCTQDRLDP